VSAMRKISLDEGEGKAAVFPSLFHTALTVGIRIIIKKVSDHEEVVVHIVSSFFPIRQNRLFLCEYFITPQRGFIV